MKLIQEHKALYKAIDKILWNDWDPLSMKVHKGPRDEYESYVPAIFSLKIKGESIEAITSKLYWIESEIMGYDQGYEGCKKVAEKIFNL